MKRAELLNKIASLLGGRAAEGIVFGDISTGAHNDLSRATDIAKSMIKEYGMSDRLAQVYFSHEKRQQYLDLGVQETADYSNATAEAIDGEISAIISQGICQGSGNPQKQEEYPGEGRRIAARKRDRTHRHGKRGHKPQNAAPAAAARCARARHASRRSQRDHLHHGAAISSGLRPALSTSQMATKVKARFTTPDDDGLEESRVRAGAGGFEDLRREIHDGVDAAELAEDRQQRCR